MAQEAAGAVAVRVFETPQAIAAFAQTPIGDRYGPTTTWELLEHSARRYADRVAISFQLTPEPDAALHETTYPELLNEARRFANAAARAGHRPGARVAILMPNTPENVFATLGGHFIGAAVPVNSLLEPEIIASILTGAEAEILVTLAPTPGSDLAEKAAAVVAQAPGVKTVVEVNLLHYLGMTPDSGSGRQMAGADLVDYRDFVQGVPGDSLEFERHVDPDDLCALFHSGGTTGAPKLVTHRHGAVVANTVIANAMLQVGAEDEQTVVLNCLPMFHVFGASVLLTGPLADGSKIVLATPAGYRTPGLIENFWKIVERHKASFLGAVPTVISAFDQLPIDADVSSVGLLVSGGSALPAPLARRFTERTGIRICEGYGMTETVAVISFNPHVGGERSGSVGFVAPYVSVRICHLDEKGDWVRDCGVDEIGEVCVQGPNVFHGYLEEERNAGLFFEAPQGPTGRFFRTGDLGRLDPDGYLWLTGRAKDLIIRGGHNIDPGMIEDALVSHPEVAFVGAVGQPDASKGELPCAFVELAEHAKVSEEALMAHVTEHVAERAARPVAITILPELPKTAVGKVFKPALRMAATVRVCEDALRRSGLATASVTVEDDKKQGQTVVVGGVGAEDEPAVRDALDGLARSWRLAT